MIGAALLLLSAGCFNSKMAVTERASKEFQCPAPQVRVEELGGGAYRIFACGNQATYACSPRMEMCLKEPGGVAVGNTKPAATKPAATMPPTTMPPTTMPPTTMPPTQPPSQFPGAAPTGTTTTPTQPGWPRGTTYPGTR